MPLVRSSASCSSQHPGVETGLAPFQQRETSEKMQQAASLQVRWLEKEVVPSQPKATSSKLPPSAATLVTAMAAIPNRSASARIRARTLNAAISPSMACCSILSRTKCSISLAGARTSNQALFAPLAIPTAALPKISCACYARYASPLGSNTPSSPQLLWRYRSWLSRSSRFRASGCEMS